MIAIAFLYPNVAQSQLYMKLDIESKRQEREWVQELSEIIGGDTEVTVEFGRVDVLTQTFAIEVDRFSKFHECIGQAIHYSTVTKRTGVVALFVDGDGFRMSKANFIYTKLCEPHGLAMWILIPRDIQIEYKGNIKQCLNYWISSTGKVHNNKCYYYSLFPASKVRTLSSFFLMDTWDYNYPTQGVYHERETRS